MRARDASSQAKHIMVGHHSGLECKGKTKLVRWTGSKATTLTSETKNTRMGKYDGLHMYSQQGAEALTQSLLTICHKSGMVRRPDRWSLPSSRSSSEQWSAPRAGRGFRSNNGGRNRGNNGQFEIPINNRFRNFC